MGLCSLVSFFLVILLGLVVSSNAQVHIPMQYRTHHDRYLNEKNEFLLSREEILTAHEARTVARLSYHHQKELHSDTARVPLPGSIIPLGGTFHYLFV
mmetsp:Transcript_5286/g.9241  ORF Transcript_5286/g.9241 Transcript_5286/m.9241 type:complete len:98 (+) Transcript_5286:112-405(+)